MYELTFEQPISVSNAFDYLTEQLKGNHTDYRSITMNIEESFVLSITAQGFYDTLGKVGPK
ncbi:hypothetical protein CL618_00900 [archaeon]|nr:hypothetical protein [archaeon]|tara:strand:+ start:126 stop:308 length:183 start_codon:yes stop_codon:yes gene_type:complete